MHINIHYPDIISEIGPLEPLSCIRMEAKHREGKQVAHSSANRINLPYSIAKRHQLKFCFRLLAGRDLSLKISFSSVQTVNVTEVKEFSNFRHIFVIYFLNIFVLQNGILLNGLKLIILIMRMACWLL